MNKQRATGTPTMRPGSGDASSRLPAHLSTGLPTGGPQPSVRHGNAERSVRGPAALAPSMKVSELIDRLKEMPPEADVYIHDADEGCLIRMSASRVWHETGDKNYPFERVEIGGMYDDDRVPMDDSWWQEKT